MRKIKELLGLPVLDLSTGKQVGEVKDVVIDTDKFLMVGILLSHANWFHTGKGILTEHIHSIGDDSITINNETVIVDEQEIAKAQHICLCDEMLGKQIVTNAGTTLGTLSDIFVDGATGTLTGYEISDSVIRDLLEGRRAMPLPPTQQIGEETVIIPDAAAQLARADWEKDD